MIFSFFDEVKTKQAYSMLQQNVCACMPGSEGERVYCMCFNFTLAQQQQSIFVKLWVRRGKSQSLKPQTRQ